MCECSSSCILAERRDSDTEKENASIIRAAIDKASSGIIGRGYIAEVANRWPWGEDDPAESIMVFIKRYLRHNLISRAAGEIIQEEFAVSLGVSSGQVHVLCKLASFGLIGWPQQEAATGA